MKRVVTTVCCLMMTPGKGCSRDDLWVGGGSCLEGPLKNREQSGLQAGLSRHRPCLSMGVLPADGWIPQRQRHQRRLRASRRIRRLSAPAGLPASRPRGTASQPRRGRRARRGGLRGCWRRHRLRLQRPSGTVSRPCRSRRGRGAGLCSCRRPAGTTGVSPQGQIGPTGADQAGQVGWWCSSAGRWPRGARRGGGMRRPAARRAGWGPAGRA